MVRTFRWTLPGVVVGAGGQAAECGRGYRAPCASETSRPDRPRVRLADGVRAALEDGALRARWSGGVRSDAARLLGGICRVFEGGRQAASEPGWFIRYVDDASEIVLQDPGNQPRAKADAGGLRRR